MIKVNKRDLYNALRELSRLTRGATLPIMACVRLKTVCDSLQVSATDLKSDLVCDLPAIGSCDLDVAIPAKVLTKIVKPDNAKDQGDVAIKPLDRHRLSLEFDGLETTLEGLDPKEFPKPSSLEGLESTIVRWPAKPLRETLAYVNPAASQDECRPHLNAVYFEDSKAIATDGHRLHSAPLPDEIDRPILVASSASQTLQRILGADDSVLIETCETLAMFAVGRWELTTRLVDAKFPPYKQVIPDSDRPIKVRVETKKLLKAVDKIGAIVDKGQAELRVNGSVAFASADPNNGQASIAVPLVESLASGKELHSGINLAYLKDALARKVTTAELAFGDTLDPFRVDLAGGFLAVIMPMRV
jgi:DNA polymerase-3 subunit beta